MRYPPSKMCVSLLPDSAEQLADWIRQYGEADMFELRLDRFPEINFEWLRRLTDKPLIVTLRLAQEGGFWTGSENERRDIFQQALNAGMDYLDVEWQSAPSLLPLLSRPPGSGIVLSHHTQTTEFEELRDIFDRMLTFDANVYKLVFPAHSLNDNLAALKLLEYSRSRKAKAVVHASGEAGTVSRLIGALRGNCWTYLAPDARHRTAPGQITLGEAVSYFFLKEKSPASAVVGLVGHPIEQSRGWRLHNLLLHNQKRTSGNGSRSLHDFIYLNFPTADFTAFWEPWKNYLDGLSVTLPHKEKIVPYLEHLSPAVQVSGVCNTVIKRQGHWWGFNTDLHALLELLQPHRQHLQQGVLIIGTGATARSAIAALQQLEIEQIFITGRNIRRGKFLRDIFGIHFLPLNKLEEAKISGIIQTTPVGMFPHGEQIPPGSRLFREGMVVLDVVYNPPLTRFLNIAREKGCTIISGEEMFLRQAAKQFEIFSGCAISLEEVRRAWKQIQTAAEV